MQPGVESIFLHLVLYTSVTSYCRTEQNLRVDYLASDGKTHRKKLPPKPPIVLNLNRSKPKNFFLFFEFVHLCLQDWPKAGDRWKPEFAAHLSRDLPDEVKTK